MEINQWLSACDVIGEQAKKRGVKIETITDLRCSVYTTPAVFTGNLRLRGHGSRLVLQIENMHNRSNGLAHDGFAVVDLDAVVANPNFTRRRIDLLKNSIAATLAVVCIHPESAETYRDELRNGERLHTGRALAAWFLIKATEAQECETIPSPTKVEIVDDTGGEKDRVVKVRYFNDRMYRRDENGNVIGSGVEREVYGIASEFGTKVDLGVKVSKAPEKFYTKNPEPIHSSRSSEKDQCREEVHNASSKEQRRLIIKGSWCGELLGLKWEDGE